MTRNRGSGPLATTPPPSPRTGANRAQSSRASSLSLVRYRTNDYSAPVAYGRRDVLVKGYVDQVVISCGSEVIAQHKRSYERDDFVFDPIHYLPLLEQKAGALDQAAPALLQKSLNQAIFGATDVFDAKFGSTPRAYIA